MMRGQLALSLLLVVGMCNASGCQNVALVSAHKEAAEGQYAAAHRDYQAALNHPDKLNRTQRRQALDGVCLTEHLIGAPTYSLERQYIDCTRAAAEPGSDSGQTVTQIEKAMRVSAELKTEQALNSHNLSEAIWNARDYSRKPGASRAKIAEWSGQMWQLVASRDRAQVSAPQKRLRPAIARLSRENPHLRRLRRQAFERWVRAQVTVNGQVLVSDLVLKGATLRLWVPERAMPVLAANLDRLSRVNDGFAAWCGCDAKTDVGLSNTGLPAYLLRLDPDTARSQVLVLAPG
jgi:hypothetical protein